MRSPCLVAALVLLAAVPTVAADDVEDLVDALVGDPTLGGRCDPEGPSFGEDPVEAASACVGPLPASGWVCDTTGVCCDTVASCIWWVWYVPTHRLSNGLLVPFCIDLGPLLDGQPASVDVGRACGVSSGA